MIAVRVLVAGSVLAVLAACGGDDAPDDDTITVGTSPATDPASPTELVIERCEELDEAQLAEVDGSLAVDPEVAMWQQMRADVGLPSDEEATRAAAEAEPETPEASAFSWPMTDDEYEELAERQESASAAADEVRPLVEEREDFAGVGLDNRTGLAWVGTTGDVDALQAELDDALGADRVRVEARPATWAHLDELSELVSRHLQAIGQDDFSLGSGNQLGRLTVGLEVLDPLLVSGLAAAFREDVPAMCVSGADPADVVPEGAQPDAGDGWRLLADEDGVGVPYDTGFAADADAYDALWDEVGLEGEPPEVDFDDEVVVYLGPAVGGGCEDIRMDDVVIGEVVEPVIVLPGGNRGCDDSAAPHAYVVAIERDRLPERFDVSVGLDEADTDVELEP